MDVGRSVDNYLTSRDLFSPWTHWDSHFSRLHIFVICFHIHALIWHLEERKSATIGKCIQTKMITRKVITYYCMVWQQCVQRHVEVDDDFVQFRGIHSYTSSIPIKRITWHSKSRYTRAGISLFYLFEMIMRIVYNIFIYICLFYKISFSTLVTIPFTVWRMSIAKIHSLAKYELKESLQRKKAFSPWR